MAVIGKMLITSETVQQKVHQLGCKGASQSGVDQVLGTYNNLKNFDQRYSYRAAFDDLMRLHDGLRAAGCVERDSLEGPMKATYRLAELHNSFSRPAVPLKSLTGMGGTVLLAGLTPPGAVVAGIAVSVGALGMVCSAAYEMFGG
jgi:hypothetical protein